MSNRSRALLMASCACLIVMSGCIKDKSFEVPPLDDQPVVERASVKDMPWNDPAFGVVVQAADGKLQIEVNVEADDSARIKIGQSAQAYLTRDKDPIACEVVRVLKNVSAETGQSIAWLKPKQPIPPDLLGEFAYATITTQIKRAILSVPKESIFIRNGRTLVVRAEKTNSGALSYSPIEIEMGIVSDDSVEVRSGLKSQDSVVTQSGIGLLYPEFKSNQEGD